MKRLSRSLSWLVAHALCVLAMALFPSVSRATLLITIAPAPARAIHAGGAPAVHTGTHVTRHARFHHAAHRHARHHAARIEAQFVRHRSDGTRPLPVHPASHSGAKHGATLPTRTLATRHHAGSKTGGRHALAIVTGGSMLAVSVRTLDLLQNDSVNLLGVPSVSGRGPPRAGPNALSGSFRFAGPRSTLRPALSETLPVPPPLAPASCSVDGPCAPRDLTPTSLSFEPRCRLRRLHADRPEGAAACSILPSSGGST